MKAFFASLFKRNVLFSFHLVTIQIVLQTMALVTLRRVIPRFSVRMCSSQASAASEARCSKNDVVAPRVRNKNPMNLEMMRIGRKPMGWGLEDKNRTYWNKLELEISNSHTTATVTHWTGRVVARASTQEWSIRQFLYNLTDSAALKVVGQVISQRCLETGVSEVHLEVSQEDRAKEKMVKFIDVIEQSGLSLREPAVYQATNPHIAHSREIPTKKVKPWTVLEPEDC